MIYLILFLETILIVFWIEIEYDTSYTNYLPASNAKYSAHCQVDIIGNTVLVLKEIPEEKKFTIWNNSNLKIEMLSYFPNIELMESFFIDSVEDNGSFKANFIAHLRDLHGDYIGAIITKEEFILALNTPPSQ